MKTDSEPTGPSEIPESRLIDGLSRKTRLALRRLSIVFDFMVLSLRERQVGTLAHCEQDLRLIEDYREKHARTDAPMIGISHLLLGLQDAVKAPEQENITRITRYRSSMRETDIGSEKFELIGTFAHNPYLPTAQKGRTCTAEADYVQCLQRSCSDFDADSAHSRQWLYVLSGQLFDYAPGEGRTFTDILHVLLVYGYLTEAKCPYGDGVFDERQEFSKAQFDTARSRRPHGAMWIDGADATIDVALDLTRAKVLRFSVPLVVAVKVYENWIPCYETGMIRRHTADEELLGGHAMTILGFEDMGIKWAVLSNSWGEEFGKDSPLGVPGVAMIPLDYLREILYHGAYFVTRTKEEFEDARDILLGRCEALEERKIATRELAGSMLHRIVKIPMASVAVVLGVAAAVCLALPPAVGQGLATILSGLFMVWLMGRALPWLPRRLSESLAKTNSAVRTGVLRNIPTPLAVFGGLVSATSVFNVLPRAGLLLGAVVLAVGAVRSCISEAARQFLVCLAAFILFIAMADIASPFQRFLSMAAGLFLMLGSGKTEADTVRKRANIRRFLRM